mmetsp:Transcript_57512/g.168923  ORF Transcript_57512/g.168923 Transcript_57512/m.168923 type:complete len:302 (-) Transcript_57512:154-1059(-)
MPEPTLEFLGLRHHQQPLLGLEDPASAVGQVQEPGAHHHSTVVDHDDLPGVQEVSNPRVVRVRRRCSNLHVVFAHEHVVLQPAALAVVEHAHALVHGRPAEQSWTLTVVLTHEGAAAHVLHVCLPRRREGRRDAAARSLVVRIAVAGLLAADPDLLAALVHGRRWLAAHLAATIRPGRAPRRVPTTSIVLRGVLRVRHGGGAGGPSARSRGGLRRRRLAASGPVVGLCDGRHHTRPPWIASFGPVAGHSGAVAEARALPQPCGLVAGAGVAEVPEVRDPHLRHGNGLLQRGPHRGRRRSSA